MMSTTELFEYLIAKKDLTTAMMQEAIEACITGQFNDVQIAVFLALMRMKGETAQELSAAALVMRNFAHHINLNDNLVDIVGTGGDGKNTFNVSTAASFVVAAAGIPVAKHGNRSVSSKSGSADLLEYAGFNLNLSDRQVQQCMQTCGLAFLFAPHYHPAMKHARVARQQLGIKSLFNLLGPLINPAQVKKQVIGVYSRHWMHSLASVLVELGSTRALVVSSEDGLDEISIAAPTNVLEYKDGHFKEWKINPKDYGLDHDSIDSLVVSSPQQSLDVILPVFSGESGPARDIVLLNSAAAIYCSSKTLSYQEALELAKETIDNGKALQCFEDLKNFTLSFKG